MQEPLFDAVERSDGSPARYTEDSFAFLNRASGIVWERLREKLDAWYAAFPDDDGDLRRRFRSADPRQHFAAWWEIYLHALLTALGYKLTVHPTVPGTEGHPDFLAARGDESFYVEGVTVFSGIVAPSRRARLEAAVKDAIETIDASLFMVNLQFDRVGQSMPKKSAITKPIEAWLATLDADELLAASERGELASHPERDVIVRRYLKKQAGCTTPALAQLADRLRWPDVGDLQRHLGLDGDRHAGARSGDVRLALLCPALTRTDAEADQAGSGAA